jgi:Helix-turn-helix domain
MARPAKLSPMQREEVSRRLAAGEGVRALAREYGVGPATIMRVSVAEQPEQVRAVAKQVADAQTALAALPVQQQYMAVSLAERLRNISQSLASAAELGSATAHRLHALANSEVAKVDDAEPMASLDSLRNVGVLTKLANESSHIALNLLASNKERVKAMDDPGEQALSLAVSFAAPTTTRNTTDA